MLIRHLISLACWDYCSRLGHLYYWAFDCCSRLCCGCHFHVLSPDLWKNRQFSWKYLFYPKINRKRAKHTLFFILIKSKTFQNARAHFSFSKNCWIRRFNKLLNSFEFSKNEFSKTNSAKTNSAKRIQQNEFSKTNSAKRIHVYGMKKREIRRSK